MYACRSERTLWQWLAHAASWWGSPPVNCPRGTFAAISADVVLMTVVIVTCTPVAAVGDKKFHWNVALLRGMRSNIQTVLRTVVWAWALHSAWQLTAL